MPIFKVGLESLFYEDKSWGGFTLSLFCGSFCGALLLAFGLFAVLWGKDREVLLDTRQNEVKSPQADQIKLEYITCTSLTDDDKKWMSYSGSNDDLMFYIVVEQWIEMHKILLRLHLVCSARGGDKRWPQSKNVSGY